MSVYDRWGFDEDGFNREGYNKMGFDRDGYNKWGFDIHGFNRQGINQKTMRDKDGYDVEGYDIEGYNREGFNKQGYGRDGFNKRGYDIDGYDREGYNEDGYDRDGYDIKGYDHDGYNHSGFNASGYDRKGYDKDGYNKDGYDKEGYDRYGFGLDGYDRAGYNKTGYNRKGYDRDGYDKDGYDADGYDKDGYDCKGFDIYGFDREGYDLLGYDRDGFNRDGIDRDGFDRNGYDKDGFNRNGYDAEGYDCKGFNILGYNRKGYDKEGYDRHGYNSQGYNREGYDIDGYDRTGFNKIGYDREGYNRAGFNNAGYNREGFDRWGFDKNGFDRNGFDIYGNDVEGYNIFGFDAAGFDRNGIHRDGFAKSDFDEDGYHLFTGFNLQGYDREGYNINGYDHEGYDREGYGIDGYDKNGFNRNGFNRSGYDKNGFNINGFNASGYDKEGYNIDGFNRSGYDREGYDREGYNKEGYDRYGYDRNGKEKTYSIHDLKPGMTIYHVTLGQGTIIRFEEKRRYIVLKYPHSKEEFTYTFPDSVGKWLEIEKPEKLKQKESSFSSSEDEKEKKWYSDLTRHLRWTYLPQKLARAEAEFKPQIFTFINSGGFIDSKEVGPGIDSVRDKAKSEVSLLIGNPYFAHIDYSKDPDLYIGKKGIPGYVTDWADKKASLYYQYQMYIGNAATGLKLVREIDFGGGKYLGYRDLYNALTSGTGKAAKYADERLSKIIMSNQQDKKIHDIIETIQQNQYEIITQDKRSDILVLGCAGSGKTMILMHRIRFMKYNDPNMDMKNVMVISPTDVLGNESRELSKILDVSAVQQLTMTELYRRLISEMLKSYYEEANLLEAVQLDDTLPDKAFYDYGFLEECVRKILLYLNVASKESEAYRKEKAKSLEEYRKLYHEMHGGYRDFQHKHSLYRKAMEDLEKYNEEDYIKVIRRCNQTKKEINELTARIRFAELVYGQADLAVDTTPEEEKKNKTYDFSGVLHHTSFLANFIDIDELYRYVKKNKISCESTARFIQLLCAFKLEGQNIKKEWLMSARKELEEYTDAYIFAHISEMRKRLHSLEVMPRKADIIQCLMSKELIKKGTRSTLTDQEVLKAGTNLQVFFDEMKWEKGQVLPFADFELYEQLQARTRRLKEFEEKGIKWRFLQDMICDELCISDEDGSYTLNASQLFAFAYILRRISDFVISDEKYVFVDEFQDFANTEIAFLRDIMPRGIFNLFGDYLQCINPKGIKSADAFELKNTFQRAYEINENYRNAKAITQYVNRRFGMKMLGIGLAGSVIQKKAPVSMKLDKGDRGAIIVADTYQGTVNIPGIENFDFKTEGTIHRNAYNLIPVSMAKGLEFEKVIVITDGMTENQKYVACTRAINQLQVVEQ